MKGLLQSKRFKKNLGKWVFMYVLCMGLFTTVVTYSKYISNMMDNADEARVSKFNINLKYCDDEDCVDPKTENSTVKKYRPFDEMVYYFIVDTSNLEVDVNLVLTANIDSHFKIKEIKEIGNDNAVNFISENSIKKSVIAGTQNLIKYKVTVVYDINQVTKDQDQSNKNPIYIFDEKNAYDILTIGYSATQIK